MICEVQSGPASSILMVEQAKMYLGSDVNSYTDRLLGQEGMTNPWLKG